VEESPVLDPQKSQENTIRERNLIKITKKIEPFFWIRLSIT